MVKQLGVCLFIFLSLFEVTLIEHQQGRGNVIVDYVRLELSTPRDLDKMRNDFIYSISFYISVIFQILCYLAKITVHSAKLPVLLY